MTEAEFDLWEAARGILSTLETWDTREALTAMEAGQGGQHLVVGIQGEGVRILLEVIPRDEPVSGRLFRGVKATRGFLGEDISRNGKD